MGIGIGGINSTAYEIFDKRQTSEKRGEKTSIIHFTYTLYAGGLFSYVGCVLCHLRGVGSILSVLFYF